MGKRQKGITALQPIAIAIFLVSMILGVYAFNLEWIPAVAVGLAVAGLYSAFMPRTQKTGIMLLLAGVAIFVLSPQLGALSIETPGVTAPAVAGFAVTPATVTAGTSVSGTTFSIPETHNTTAGNLSRDPFEVQFTIVRTDSSTEDASCEVTINPPNKVVDTATGIAYDIVAKDSLDRYKIYVNDSSAEIQTLDRALSFKFGTTDSYTIKVKYDLNPAAFTYADLYETIVSSINVCGSPYSVSIQKTSSVA